MSRSTGPILTAGALTWANQTVLSDDMSSETLAANTVRIGVATGLLASLFYGMEKIAPAFAIPLAYVALVTTLVVRIEGKPTPLERLLSLAT